MKQVEWVWPLLLAGTVLMCSGTRAIAVPEIDLVLSKDKIGHFLVFGLLATSIVRVPNLRNQGFKGMAIAALITISFGGLDEFRQSFTPGRSVEFADWIADTLGAVVAVLAYRYIHLYRRLLEWPLRLQANAKIVPPPAAADQRSA